MIPIVERCAGLDVHQATVMATVRVPDGAGGRRSETARWDATTIGLLGLRDWLQAHGVTHVAMESTGIYWKPVYFILEDVPRLTVLLVNAQHVKRVPGRKTDVQDSEWLAQLLECGLLQSSFVPPPIIRDLRDLTRYRTHQVRERAREVNRLHRVLEDAGLKLSSVATDVMGASGRAMLEALLHGTTDAAVLADLAKGRLRRKLPELRAALQGHFRAHHALLLGQMLAKIDFLEEAIASLTTEIDRVINPFESVLTQLDTIPGIDRKAAVVLVAETGADMMRFPTAAHLASWAGMCPGHDESAGKRRSGRTRKANRYLRSVLIESALGASRVAHSPLQATYRRVRANRGHKKAIVATAHQLLRLAYAVMHDHAPYDATRVVLIDLRRRERAAHRHLRQLEHLGYRVTIQPAA